jgi:aminopeptidase C
MKRLLSLFTLLCLAGVVVAQETEKKPEGYIFTDQKVIETTPVKNQNRSGTCWCYSTLSFLESEILREGGKAVHLSEMWIVRHCYELKAEKFVRMHGKLNFGQGGATHDVMNAIEEFGIVPEEVYRGLNYGSEKHNHYEVDALLLGYLQGVIKQKTLSPAWKDGFNAILDVYFGPKVEKFTYNGKEYTPKSFYESLGLNASDYVSLTSYTHHPFYTSFALEIQDNWRWAQSYNLPIDELMEVFDNAIMEGYTIAWGSDVSEKGFTRQGTAVLPDETAGNDLQGSDMAKWLNLTEEQKQAATAGAQKWCTQEERQLAYDNWETTDDHGMQIYGIAKDQNGTEYYMVKNSWGEAGTYKGLWYVTKAFARYKTMNIVVHKNAIPKDIRKKLNIK